MKMFDTLCDAVSLLVRRSSRLLPILSILGTCAFPGYADSPLVTRNQEKLMKAQEKYLKPYAESIQDKIRSAGTTAALIVIKQNEIPPIILPADEPLVAAKMNLDALASGQACVFVFRNDIALMPQPYSCSLLTAQAKESLALREKEAQRDAALATLQNGLEMLKSQTSALDASIKENAESLKRNEELLRENEQLIARSQESLVKDEENIKKHAAALTKHEQSLGMVKSQTSALLVSIKGNAESLKRTEESASSTQESLAKDEETIKKHETTLAKHEQSLGAVGQSIKRLEDDNKSSQIALGTTMKVESLHQAELQNLEASLQELEKSYKAATIVIEKNNEQIDSIIAGFNKSFVEIQQRLNEMKRKLDEK
jgi:ferredoxin-thioredoxin reductase catalytic subunit